MAKLQGKELELCDKITALLLEYGYRRTTYRVGHDANSARFTINTDKVVKDEAGNVDPFAKAKAEYALYCGMVEMKPEWIGTTFNYGSGRFTLQGLNMSKPKNDIVMTDSRGKTFIAPSKSVKRAIEMAMVSRGVKVDTQGFEGAL